MAPFFSSAISNRLAERLGGTGITAREQEVLELLARGLSTRAIGDRLSITEKTVRIHVSSILGVSGRTQAVLAALRRGIVHLDG